MFFDFLFGKFDIKKALQEVKALYDSQQFEEVVKKAKDALAKAEKEQLQEVEEYGELLFLQGRALTDLGNITEGEKFFLRAETFFKQKKSNDIKMMIGIDFGLSDCYIHTKQPDLAISRLQNVEKTGYMERFLMLHLKVYNSYAEAYKIKRDYEKVIECYEKYLFAYKLVYPQNYAKTVQYNDRIRMKEMLKVALAAKKANYEGEYGEDWLKYSIENGAGGLMDKIFASYLVSELPDPKQQDISEMVKSATKVQIFIYEQGEEIEKGKYLRVKKLQKEIVGLQMQELLACFEIKENEFSHLMCVGEVCFTFCEEEKVLAEIEYLGGGAIRWAEKWKEDATLINISKMENMLRRLMSK